MSETITKPIGKLTNTQLVRAEILFREFPELKKHMIFQ